jgi:uncharacterized damage-inducible protein DinB
MTQIAQSEHRDRLLAANRVVIARIRESVEGVPADALTRRPPDGGWSIAEVLEHLIVSADSYLEAVRPLVQGKKGAASDESTMWKPSLMGGLLVRSFRSPRKMPAPKRYRPSPSPRPRTLEEFVKRQEDVGRLIAEATTVNWRSVRMSSPVLPIVRMNLGDALSVLVTHAERHAAQIERVKLNTLGEKQR